MMNSYIPLCLIALVAIIQTTPTIDDYNNNSDYDENINLLLRNDLQDDQYPQSKASRHLKHIIDGAMHHIKAAGIIYRQRLRDDQCLVEYEDQYLTEYSVIQIRKKLYRVENCLLERVFHACGPNLFLMLDVVCRVVEKQPTTTTTTTTPMTNLLRQTALPTATFIHRLNRRAKKTPPVITESCCENLCTISELSRYCHR
jgi:hypothetical protein